MSQEDWIKLNDIHIKLIVDNPSLQEVKNLYLQAKEIFVNNKSRFNEDDIDLLLQIFIKGSEIVGEFWQRWQTKKLTPTNEELNLLEDFFKEGSWVFNQIASKWPHYFSQQSNQKKQDKIRESVKVVIGEKERRKNFNQPNQPSGFFEFLKENRVSFFFFCDNSRFVNFAFD